MADDEKQKVDWQGVGAAPEEEPTIEGLISARDHYEELWRASSEKCTELHNDRAKALREAADWKDSFEKELDRKELLRSERFLAAVALVALLVIAYEWDRSDHRGMREACLAAGHAPDACGVP